MPHSCCHLLYHLVFRTKEDRPYLTPVVTERLYPYLAAAIRGEGGIALAIGGVADHVHILARLKQDRALSDVVRAVKANSSKWLKQTFPECRTFAWQEGFGGFTVSASQAPKVKAYIGRQPEHHAKESSRDEFIRLLRAHGVDFDEKRI